MTTHKIVFTEAEQFFYDHAGYSHMPDEPAWSGRARCAILYAQAEAAFERSGAYMNWEIDPDADITPTDSYFVSGHPHWQAALIREDEDGIPEYLASLGSIDFGKPENEVDIRHEPYARVIRADLAMEAGLS